jgi:putative heme iron utilization protein
MLSRLELLIDLVHSASEAALATHSTTLPGYPLATVIPFATDEYHRPVMLISSLAEHTKNLVANSKASLLVSRMLEGGEMERISLIGEVRPMDADSRFIKRYLRYQPAAERFLQLGDFRFHRFEPIKIRTIGGFGKATWLDGERLMDAPTLSLADEELILQQANDRRLFGVDLYGMDVMTEDGLKRVRFGDGPLVTTVLLPTRLLELQKNAAS